MNKKALKKLVIKLIERLKRQGFTFVEAMCCIILMGYAIMPIMGVMHNASRQADRVVHRSTLGRLARSRLNEEIGRVVFDGGEEPDLNPLTYVVYQYEDSKHKLNYFEHRGADKELYEHNESTLITEAAIESIAKDISDELCTATPPPESLSPSEIASGILHIYEVKVHLKNPAIKKLKEGDPENENLDNCLKSLIVTASLVYSEGIKYKATGEPCNTEGVSLAEELPFVQPISYFTLINLPHQAAEKGELWVSANDKANANGSSYENKLLSFRLELGQAENKASGTFKIEYGWRRVPPKHIAIHPDGSKIAVVHDKIRGMSGKDPSVCIIKTDESPIKYNNSTLNKPALKTSRAVFRPDGKRLFYSDKYERLRRLRLDGGNNQTPDPKTYGRPVHAGADGYLYTINPYDSEKLERFSMYAPDFSKAEAPCTRFINKVKSVVTTPDGRYVIVKRWGIGSDKTLEIYDSATLRQLSWTSFNMGTESGALGISSNGRHLIVTDGDGVYRLYDLAKNDITKVNLPPFASALSCPTGPIVYMPQLCSFAFPFDYGRQIELVRAIDGATGTVQIAKKQHGDEHKYAIEDLAVKPFQYVAVCDYDSERAEYTLKLVDVYTKKVDATKNTLVQSAPDQEPTKEVTDIAVSANEDLLFAAANQSFRDDGGNPTDNILDFDIPPDPSKLRIGRSQVCENYTQVISLNEPIYRNDYFDGSTVNDNAYLQPFFGYIGGSASDKPDYYGLHHPNRVGSSDKRPKEIEQRRFADWEIRQILPLYHGGCLVLGRKDNSSFIEWVGKVPEWAKDTSPVKDAGKKPGEYMRFATWLNVGGNQEITFSPETKTWPDNLPGEQKDFDNVPTDDGTQTQTTNFRINKKLPQGCTIDKIFYWPFSNFITFQAVVYKGDTNGRTPKYKSQVLDSGGSGSVLKWHEYVTPPGGGTASWQPCADPFVIPSDDDYYVGIATDSKTKLFHKYAVNETNLYQKFDDTSWHDPEFDYSFYFEITDNNETIEVEATFPPLGAKKMAVSADDKILAITAGSGSSADKVHFYDLSVFDYGPLIQPRGIVELKANATYTWPVIATCAAYSAAPDNNNINKNLLDTQTLVDTATNTVRRFGYFQSPWANEVTKLNVAAAPTQPETTLSLMLNTDTIYTVYNENNPESNKAVSMPGGLTVPMQLIASQGYEIKWDSKQFTKDNETIDLEGNYNNDNSNSSFLAFKHEPVLIAKPGLRKDGDYEAENIAFNKDIAKPTLYLVCKKQGDTTPKIAKLDPLSNFSGTTGCSIDETSPLVFTPDGQNIAYLYKDGAATSTLHFYNINDEIATAVTFADDPKEQKLINPTLIAAKPFNTYKSTGRKGQGLEEDRDEKYMSGASFPSGDSCKQYKAAMLDGKVWFFARGTNKTDVRQLDLTNNLLARFDNSSTYNENVISALTYDNKIYLVRGTETDKNLEIDCFDPDSKKIKPLYKYKLPLYQNDNGTNQLSWHGAIAACTSPFGIIILTAGYCNEPYDRYIYSIYLYMPHGAEKCPPDNNNIGCLAYLGQSPYAENNASPDNMWWGLTYNYIGDDATILWHKGYLYIMPDIDHDKKIGRIKCSSPQELKDALQYDFEHPTSHNFDEYVLDGKVCGACSFGNEIFIVSLKENQRQYLYNPNRPPGYNCGDTNFTPVTLIPCGSSILIFSKNGCKGSTPYFYRFTP